MTRSTQVKTDKIVAYHPDGSRQTLGYRVEQRTEQKIRHRARPPFSAYVDRDPTLKPGNTTPDGRSKTYITNPPRKLPPVVHTEHFKREKHKTLAGPSNLPAGWKHKETKERYDYHKGMKEASYAANTVTHKVMFFGPSPVRRTAFDLHCASVN